MWCVCEHTEKIKHKIDHQFDLNKEQRKFTCLTVIKKVIVFVHAKKMPLGKSEMNTGVASNKQWSITQSGWIPQSLESQSAEYQFPIYRPTSSQGLYAATPFGFRKGGWATLASMVLNHGGYGRKMDYSDDDDDDDGKGGVIKKRRVNKKVKKISTTTNVSMKGKTNQSHYSIVALSNYPSVMEVNMMRLWHRRDLPPLPPHCYQRRTNPRVIATTQG